MGVRPNRPELNATKIPSAIDIAWSAGIYEGEGTCRLCGKTKRGLMAAVVQKDPELLFRLREWFGGSIQSTGNGSGCSTWNICGDRARVFLALIHPFMTVRRKIQIESSGALDFLSGSTSEGLSADQIRERLDDYNLQLRKTTWRGNAEVRKRGYAKSYEKRKTAGQGNLTFIA